MSLIADIAGQFTLGAGASGALPFVGPVLSAAQSHISEIFAPSALQNKYFNWQQAPIVIPTVETLIDLFNRGLLGKDSLANLCQAHGVYMPDGAAPGFAGVDVGDPMKQLLASTWRSVQEASRPKPGISDLLNLYWTGRFTWNDLVRAIRKLGADEGEWANASQLGWWYPTIAEAIGLNLRQYMPQGDYDRVLSRNRVKDSLCGVRSWLEGLRRQLPAPADQITFAVHDAWDKRLVDGLGLDAEFPPEFHQWLSRLGLAWPLNQEPGIGQLDPALTWALVYWRSHWRTLAPEQIYDLGALFRGDGGRADAVPRGLALPGGGLDIDPLLKQADFPPAVRPLLAERAKRRPPREDWVQMLAYGTATKDQVIEGLKDENYDPKTLNQVADMIERKATEQRLKNPIGRSVEAVTTAYEWGAIGAQEAFDLLLPFMQTQEQAGWLLSMADTKIKTRLHRRIIAGLKARRRLGEYDTREHYDALIAAGVDPARAKAFADEAELEIHAKYRYVSIHDIRRYLVSGFFSPTEADQRLARLNMTPGDRATLIQEAMARRQRALARQAKADQREAEAAARKAAKAMQEQRARVMRIYTIARLKLFFEDGTMPELEIREVLDFAYQWPTEAQDRLLASWRAPGQKIGIEAGEEKVSGAGARAGEGRGGVTESITFGGEVHVLPPAEPSDLERRLTALRKWYTPARIRRYYEDDTMDGEEVRELLAEVYGLDDVTINREIATWKSPGQAIGVEPP